MKLCNNTRRARLLEAGCNWALLQYFCFRLCNNVCRARLLEAGCNCDLLQCFCSHRNGLDAATNIGLDAATCNYVNKPRFNDNRSRLLCLRPTIARFPHVFLSCPRLERVLARHSVPWAIPPWWPVLTMQLRDPSRLRLARLMSRRATVSSASSTRPVCSGSSVTQSTTEGHCDGQRDVAVARFVEFVEGALLPAIPLRRRQ